VEIEAGQFDAAQRLAAAQRESGAPE
jgi:hypothetical protein